MLTHQNCRSEDERVRDGVVGLRGALGKGAAVPLPYIGGDLARNVRNSNQLSFEIAAAVVSGLAQVTHPFACRYSPAGLVGPQLISRRIQGRLACLILASPTSPNLSPCKEIVHCNAIARWVHCS